ncbi:MAG: tetratricopeptide repeat protein [Desulfohalobiaceae bacterium]|nr:tetratricopeptide repeat protein [Desulfohalobiaceae bacterium]
MRKLCVLLVLIWGVALGAADAFGMPGAAVLGMSSQKNGSMGRISFLFDDIPEFEIQESGQRVRLRFLQTRFGQSFQKASPDEILVQTKVLQEAGDSIVELYLHNVPVHVDVTKDARSARMDVNIFWDRRKIGIRPAILDQRLGRLQPIQGGIAAQKVIRSDYQGRWIDFFQEFEWPLTVSVPVRFSFPSFPSPLFQENADDFPDGFLQAGRRKLWGQALHSLKSAGSKAESPSRKILYTLMRAECHLRNESAREAVHTLREIETAAPLAGGKAWKAYFRAYAQTVNGKWFVAARIAETGAQDVQKNSSLWPWYALLQAELALMTGQPAKALRILDTEASIPGRLSRVYVLRQADALHALHRLDSAFERYREVTSNLALLREKPASLSVWSELLYQKTVYADAYRYFFLLSEVLQEESPEKTALAEYGSAMARLKEGRKDEAKQMLLDVQDNFPATEGGFRSRLKRLDLQVLQKQREVPDAVLSKYREIAAGGSTRNIREEAFFKQILVCHLAGRDLQAVKLLGRFFRDYWAGPLQDEAQALFIEIFPSVVETLVDTGASFEALSLVAKHRDLLAQARITYDFLNYLAQSYLQVGFYDQAVETYLYLLDFEKNPSRKQSCYAPLIKVYAQQQAFEKVRHYAQRYLAQYPEGSERATILYFYAKSLLKNNNLPSALKTLFDKTRPVSVDLDRLSAEVFWDLQKYDLVEHYLSRAAKHAQGRELREINWQRAEAMYQRQQWNKAVSLYRSLLEHADFKNQAQYRLVEAYFKSGQRQQALKFYEKMTEEQDTSHWRQLAAGTVFLHNSVRKERGDDGQ